MLYPQLDSPVTEVTFGEGMLISLNNYYDILKAQAGGLGANEFLQLKLVADGLDISDTLDKGGRYEWFTYYNMLNRADLEIEPQPLSGTVLTGVARISDIYGKFIERLASLVSTNVLTAQEQETLDNLNGDLDSIIKELGTLATNDFKNWQVYSQLRGYSAGDMAAYNQWSSVFGESDKIQELLNLKTIKTFQKIQVLNKTYNDPDDKEIIDALVAYYNSAMRLCYPTYPDYSYLPTVISLNYLSGLPHASTGVYDDRYVVAFDKTLDFLKTAVQGSLSASFDHSTESSNSITTDWSNSVSVGYMFVNVNISASEHKAISQDFKKAVGMTLSSKATLRVNINYGPWFKPNLFESKYIKEHPELFQEFFGSTGTLLYYPTALILIRGFKIEFDSSSAWTYDYNKTFSASGGGGFNVFGINFGDSASYGENITEHKIDQTGTKLTISDDDNTLRFVGYVVKPNTLLKDAIIESKKHFAEMMQQ